jgi:hypothetical protein
VVLFNYETIDVSPYGSLYIVHRYGAATEIPKARILTLVGVLSNQLEEGGEATHQNHLKQSDNQDSRVTGLI